MTHVLESAPVHDSVDHAVEVELRRQLEREQGYQAAVESTYWYMLAMLVLGLFAAFWIVVMART